MKKLKKENYSVLGILFVLAVCSVIIPSFSLSKKDIYTKEELREVIVGTALSYLYNNEYSDYNQTSFTDIPTTTKQTNGEASSLPVSYMPRNFNTTPESINRTNKYFIDCTSFVTSVYINALDYDFSEYYEYALNYNDSPKTPTSTTYYYNGIYNKTANSQADFKNAYKLVGRGNASGFFHALGANLKPISSNANPYKNDRADNTSPVVFYYKATGSEDETTKKNVKEKFINTLRKGDIIVYQNSKDGNLAGHALIFVGDEISNKHSITLTDKAGNKTTYNNIGGVIHATGADFSANANENFGYDEFSVRYNSLTTPLANIFPNDKRTTTQVTILRPVNDLCNGTKDKCPVTLTANQLARAELSQLRYEQYASLRKEYKEENESYYRINTLSQYNSVNKGDEITYNLYLENVANYGYCSSNKPVVHQTKEQCVKANFKWITRTSELDNYKNLKVTASIPSNTTYVSSTNGGKESKGTITWQNINLSSTGEPITLTYTVKVLDGNEKIVNPGMKITTPNGNVLTMASSSINVNPTVNGINVKYLKDTIKNHKSTNSSSIQFVKDIYNKEFNINLDMLTTSNIKTALFNHMTTVTAKSGVKHTPNNFFEKKTESEISKITNKDHIVINKLLVKGLYGGRNLHGNENKDRANFIRTYDFEVGDIIVVYPNGNVNTMNMYIYAGFEDGEALLYTWNSKGLQRCGKGNSPSGYGVIKKLYNASLFAVLRPTQYYGTTVKLNYMGGKVSTDKSFVARNTYKHLPSTSTKNGYTTQLVYNYENRTQIIKNNVVFAGWYSDTSYKNLITNNTKLLNNQTHTLYAKWDVLEKSLPIPNREGYYFNGWYKNQGLTDKVNLSNYATQKDTILYAKWNPKVQYISELRVQGNQKYIEIKVDNNSASSEKIEYTGYDVYKKDSSTGTYSKVEYEIKNNNTYIVKCSTNTNVNDYILVPYNMVAGNKVYADEQFNSESINEEDYLISDDPNDDMLGKFEEDTEEIILDEEIKEITSNEKKNPSLKKIIIISIIGIVISAVIVTIIVLVKKYSKKNTI